MILTVLGSIGPWLPGIMKSFEDLFQTEPPSGTCSSAPSSSTVTAANPADPCSSSEAKSNSPNFAGADPVPNLSLPKTILSNIDGLIASGGVLQSSPDNLTVYNLGVRMRLIGGLLPHDELLGQGLKDLGSYSSWGVETNVTGVWTSLEPVSNNFTIVGTNSTATYVMRTMILSSPPFSGVLRVVYKATSAGPLKCDLQFVPTRSGHYRLTYSWLDLPSRHSLSSASRQLRVKYGSANYTFSWSDVPSWMNATTELVANRFRLQIDIGLVNNGTSMKVDPSIIGFEPGSAIAYSSQRKVFYEPKGGYYFLFYFSGLNVLYAYSHDGTHWSGQAMPTGWPDYTDPRSSSLYVWNSAQTVVVATGQGSTLTFTCSTIPCRGLATATLYYSVGTISGPNISWQTNPSTRNQVFPAATIPRWCANNAGASCTVSLAVRYVSVAVGVSGQLAFSFNIYASGPVIAGEGDGVCLPDSSTESDVGIVYQGGVGFADCESDSFDLHSTILTADSQGDFRVIYQYHGSSGIELRTRLIGGTQGVASSLPAVADTFISRCCGQDNQNFGNKYYLTLNAPIPNTIYEADVLVKFQQPQFPAGSMVESNANITFTLYQTGQGTDDVIVCEPFPWNEMNVTFDNFPGVLPGSCSKIPGVPLTMTAGNQLILPVQGQIMGRALRNWAGNNGLYIALSSSNANPPPGVNFDSRETGTTTSPKLSIGYTCCIGQTYYTLEPNEDSTGNFSAAVDANYGIHVVFQRINAGVTHAYLPLGGLWSFTTDIFNHCFTISTGTFCLDVNPAITIDFATNDIYVFGVLSISPQYSSQLPSIELVHKSLSQKWSDATPQTVAVNASASYLGSNMVSVSGTSASWLSIIWTDTQASNGLFFESIPIQAVWSPFASPSDPWDGYGVSPYGKYFENLGEYVSTSTGLLTIHQTELSLPGRGLSLDVSFVYTEPYSFLLGNPNNFETYPYAPTANGWQLDLPWIGGSGTSQNTAPRYVHLWSGEGYLIPSSFWNGNSGAFENHQGEHFRMARSFGDIALYSRNGLAYHFDPYYLTLMQIVDPSGNTINFTYGAGNLISTITDTVGRTLLFCYGSNNKLARIDQVPPSGTCVNEQSVVRSIIHLWPNLFQRHRPCREDYRLSLPLQRSSSVFMASIPDSLPNGMVHELLIRIGQYWNGRPDLQDNCSNCRHLSGLNCKAVPVQLH